MISFLKKIINNFPILKELLLPVYLNSRNINYWTFEKFNIKFSYSLFDRTKAKFYPKGQIAKSLFFNEFEKKELEIFQSLLKPGSIMIDAGANIGLYSIIGSILVGDTGKVFSFEPSITTFNLFINNIELNKVNNIIPINKGLGDKVGEIVTLTQDSETGDAERYIQMSENKTYNVFKKIQLSESISLDTLDNFKLTNSINKVDFLKIDVEGYEYYVLKGAENLIKNNPEIIILFECAEPLAIRAGSTQNAVFTFLNNLGIDIVCWNEKEKKWSNNQVEDMKSGQLFGGRNIMTVLNNL